MIATSRFGRTGHQSTRTIFGAAALWSVSQAQADRVLEVLLDTASTTSTPRPSYGDSELRIGAVDGRAPRPTSSSPPRPASATRDGGRASRSAARSSGCRSTSVDLIQLHNLVEPDEWDLAPWRRRRAGGRVEARDEGLVRFIGVTGHGHASPRMHLRSLERFDFDSVLLPYNFVLMQDPAYAADFEALLARLRRARTSPCRRSSRIARGPVGRADAQTATTWYEPLDDRPDIDLAVHWVLGCPAVFLNTVGDLDVLPRVLDAAERFQTRPGDVEMQQLSSSRDMVPLFT